MAEELLADVVFGAGGVRGTALVGALAVAEERGYRWVNVAGTSAGAVVGGLVAAGYTAAEIKTVMDGLDYRQFMDQSVIDRIPILGHALSLGFEFGIFEGEYFERLMRDLLARKGVRTFQDLRDRHTAAHLQRFYPEDDARYRFPLQVIAADVSRGRMLVLPRDLVKYGEDPAAFEVARAIRMSMSIPFFFEPVRLNDQVTGEESIIVDGGLLSGYPVWLFDSAGEPEWPTFGFRLVEGASARVPVDRVVRNRIRGPISLFAALFTTAMWAHDARHVEEEDWVRTLPIPTLGIDSENFDVTAEQRAALYQSGQATARAFFQQWDFDRYKTDYRRPPPPGGEPGAGA